MTAITRLHHLDGLRAGLMLGARDASGRHPCGPTGSRRPNPHDGHRIRGDRGVGNGRLCRVEPAGAAQRSAQVLSSNVFFNAVFFFAGVVFGRWKEGVAYLSNRPARRLVVVVVAVVTAVVRQNLQGPESPLLALIAVVSASVAGVLAARLLFGLFGAHLNQDRPAVRWLVDSALVVYLVHQPIVIALSLLAIALRIDPVLAFPAGHRVCRGLEPRRV